jgi:chemotaxis protein MotB
MKDKPNEWVSISDLMAGVLAVVMLLLVVSVIQQTYAEMQFKLAKEQGIIAKKKFITKLFKDMESSLAENNMSNLAKFDSLSSKITFTDVIFERGSAKITPTVKEVFLRTQSRLVSFLKEVPNGKIFIEGHTDSRPVPYPVTDFLKYGAVYDDNFTLSAARAREARNILIGNLEEQYANRIIVAGYGSSMPLDPNNTEADFNRRVEIRFIIE